jgi:hypothetical protein
VTAALVFLGLGDLAWFTHFITHHRTGLTTALAATGAWTAHRARRRFSSTGQRKTGMPTLAPVAQRRPDLTARRTA